MKSVGLTPLSAPAAAPPAAPAVQTAAFDGCRWTFRREFADALALLPTSAWSDPAAQGWTRVKNNSTRSVWRAELAGRTYFLKYYFPRRWVDRLKRLLREPACVGEWRGGLFALGAGVAAVRPAGYAADLPHRDGRCALLVTEAVAPAWPLNEFWRTLQTDEQPARRRADTARLIDCVAQLIAQAHQAGFEHVDMHAENILVQRVGPRRYRAVFVDLHSARLDAPLTDRAVLRNLAQLNQWFRRHASVKDRLRVLRAYLRWRHEYETRYPHARPLGLTFRELVPALDAAADRHARRLCAQRDRRIFRDGRYFARLCVGAWRAHVQLCSKRADDASPASKLTLTRDWWRAQLADPDRWFTDGAGEDRKDSHSASVRRLSWQSDDGAPLAALVKRPRARNKTRRLRMLLPPSRSRRGWRMANALLHRHLPTPRPLAMLERRQGPLVRDSVLVTEYLDGALDLESYLKRECAARSRRDWARHKRRLIALLAHELRMLFDRGFQHRDCKASNLLVLTEPTLQLLWIDMDGLRLVRRVDAKMQQRALVRLHVSLLDAPGLTHTDRVRFLRRFCARFGWAEDAWRFWLRQMAPAADAKRGQKAARTAWKLKRYGRA